MRQCASLLFATLFLLQTPLSAEENFTPFTGKVQKSKVRMRLQPSLESAIIRELNRDELLVVTGEEEEFFSVIPPEDIKAYIYRTFVLDGVVEGSHVNVRLEPDTDSLVITQLNSGDRVHGEISPQHSKWLEIETPKQVHFYVSKDYIEKIGDYKLLSQLNKRKTEVNELLNSTLEIGSREIQKPYTQISLDDINHNLDTIINDYKEFPEIVKRAEAFKLEINEAYLEKKISYLEAKAKGVQQAAAPAREAEPTPRAPTPKPVEEPVASSNTPTPTPAPEKPAKPKILSISTPVANSEQWKEREEALFESWAGEHEDATMSTFYEEQREEAIPLRGIIEPYQRPVRNKPGDYVLLNRVNRLPVAFLYSTVVDLQNFEDQEVTISGVERPNNNFAFPAYFVISVE